MSCYKRYWIWESFTTDDRRLGSWLFVSIVVAAFMLWKQLPPDTEINELDLAVGTSETVSRQPASIDNTSNITQNSENDAGAQVTTLLEPTPVDAFELSIDANFDQSEQRVLVESSAFNQPDVADDVVASAGVAQDIEASQLQNSQVEQSQADAGTAVGAQFATQDSTTSTQPSNQLASKIQIDPQELRSLLKVDINHLIEQWREAWEVGDAERYLEFYSSEFEPIGNLSLQAWQNQRKQRIDPSRQIKVSLSDFEVVFDDANQTSVVTFEQTYLSATYNDTSIKQLTLVKDGEWRIIAEEAL